MESSYSDPLTKVIAFSAIAELATGLALIAMPAVGIALLLGPMESANVVTVTRLTAIALIALGLACWPTGHRTGVAAFRALLTYNLLVAAYFAYLCVGQQLGGILLWPVVVLHAAIAGMLLYFRIAKSRSD